MGYVSYRNGYEAVNTVAASLRVNQSEHIRQHLVEFLRVPIQIDQTNVIFFRTFGLNVPDAASLQSHFLQQVQIYPTVTSIYFGSAAGGIAGGGREGAGGAYYVYSTPDLEPGVFDKFVVDRAGNKGRLLSSVPNFDARLRPWYLDAIQKGGPAWSDIYILATGQDLAIAASAPAYNAGGRLVGVTSVDIFLSDLDKFLADMGVSQTGASFIMERSGMLVAASTGEAMFKDDDGNGQVERIYASESATPLIRQAAAALTAQWGDYRNIQSQQQLEFKVDDKKQYLQVSPIRDDYGIDWLVVVVMPEVDFMGQIQANSRDTIIVISLAVLASIALSVWAAQKINRPISQIIRSLQALSDGEWDDVIAGQTHIREINELTQTFNRTSRILRETMDSLSSEIFEREQVELSLRESEDRYRTLVENVPVGVYRSTFDGRILAANPTFRTMFGLAANEGFEDFNVIDLYVKVEERLSLLDVLRTHRSVRNMEVQLKRRDGSRFWGSITASSFRTPDGDLQYIDGTIEDVTEKKRVGDMFKYLATHDNLTEIPNRVLFDDRLSHAIKLAERRGRLLAVLFVDLDNFKMVNDRFGHTYGDDVLRLIAQRIQACIRKSDTVARLGGDEFGILLEGLSRPENAVPILQKIVATVAEPILIQGEQVQVTASIGVSIFPRDGRDAVTLIQCADRKMYTIKENGKNNYNWVFE